MRLLKKIFVALVILVALVAVAGIIYVNSLKPQYSGELALKHMRADARAYMDDFGVPHIYANNQADAYRS
jgi:penicillin amidase